MNQFDQVLEQGDLGQNNVILHSGVGRIAPDEEHILRFSLEITMADVAGSYTGNISLQGITGD
jgi:hypothetical protein